MDGQVLHLGLGRHVPQSPQVTHGQATEVEGEDGIQAAQCSTLAIGEGGDAGDEHTADFVLTGAAQEFERPPHTGCVAALGIVVTYADDISADTRENETDVGRVGIGHDSCQASFAQPTVVKIPKKATAASAQLRKRTFISSRRVSRRSNR